MRRNSTIKKLLKIFLFNFLYIFTIKIFLKNTILCLDSQKKERRRQVSAFPAIFKADFGRFRQVSAVSDLFRPYRPPADTTQYGRYCPILAESAQFGANRVASARIEPHRRESSRVSTNPRKKKKKRRREPTHEQAHRAASNASVLSRTKAGIMSLLVSTHESFQKNFQEIHLPGLKMNRCNTRLNPPPPFQPKTYLAQQIKQSLLVHMVICFFNIKLANHTQ